VPDLLGFGDSPHPESLEELWPHAQAAAIHDALKVRGVRCFAKAQVATLDSGAYLGDADQRRAIATIFGNALCELESRIETTRDLAWGNPGPSPVFYVRSGTAK
jgi:hypothetical protein